jgi:hypothetical protein
VDPKSFVSAAGENIAKLLGPLANNDSAYLVTVVDSNRNPLLVLGFTPGLGGGIGEGVAWQAPDVQSDAVWGEVATPAAP